MAKAEVPLSSSQPKSKDPIRQFIPASGSRSDPAFDLLEEFMKSGFSKAPVAGAEKFCFAVKLLGFSLG